MTTGIARALAELCGDDAVRTGVAAARCAVAGVAPDVVLVPADEASLAAALARCSQEGWVVEPAGAGTWLAAGRRPRRVDVVLSTARLTEVKVAAAADGVVTVGAGAAIAEVASELYGPRQHVPLDPPAERDATIGATFATASAGPLRLGYGTPRDHALGLTVVTGDGRRLEFGGRVVKNVAGYDIVRLLVGSRGSLGVITSLHVRVQPLPVVDATVLLPVDAPAAIELAARVGALRPVALELLAPEPMRRVLGADGWALAARFHGVREAVDDAADAALAAAARLGAAPVDAAAGGAAPARRLEPRDAVSFWDRLGALEARAALLARFAGMPARLDATLAAALRVADAGGPGAGWCVAAHAGSGIVRAWLTGVAEPWPLVDIAAALSRERAGIEAAGGSVLVPVMPAEMPDDFDPFGSAGFDPSIARIEAGLRQAFDPAGVLAPGRFTRAGAAHALEPAHA